MNIATIIGILIVIALLIWINKDKKIFKIPKKIIKQQEDKINLEEKIFIPQKVIKPKKKVKKAPLTGLCDSCGIKVIMPYKCKFCSMVFCDNHRIPEKHDCIGLKKLKREKKKLEKIKNKGNVF